MENKDNNQPASGQAPEPEALSSTAQQSPGSGGTLAPSDEVKQVAGRKRPSYKPSHKATFIGIGFIVVFLSINAAGLAWLLRSETEAQQELINNGVTLSSETLAELGVNREPVGEAAELTVGPNATFRGDLTVAENVSIGGNLQINSAFVAQEAQITNLQASEVQLEELNVNGDGTLSTLNVRENLNVNGTARFDGQAIYSQLVTINNSLNVAGNLAVGGVLSVRTFEANNLTSGGVLTVGGHIVTRGSTPKVTKGGAALGSAGTVSISGSDAAGTVAVNIGTGAGTGLLASVTFVRSYNKTPRVLITPNGGPVPGMYINRTSTGFTISTSSALSPGGYAFDFFVVE